MNQWATIYQIVRQGLQRGRLWLAIILAITAVVFLVAAWFKIHSYPLVFAVTAVIWLLLAGAFVFITVSLTRQPYILVATLAGLAHRGKDELLEGKPLGMFVQLLVTEAFYLAEGGRGEALPEKTGTLELVTNGAVYHALSTYSVGDDVMILALGGSEAIGVVTADHRLIMANGSHDLVR